MDNNDSWIGQKCLQKNNILKCVNASIVVVNGIVAVDVVDFTAGAIRSRLHGYFSPDFIRNFDRISVKIK